MNTNKNFPQRIITKTVWMLSLVSLFTDMASEMLYPVMPMFFNHIGFTVLFIGILEGIAEAVAGLTKPYFGKKSDVTGKRLPFVQLGYGLSALSKPMMAIFFNPLWIFFARTIDRLGKGIRTGARDALLSSEATQKTKASVFGFHRSMDTLGAVLGPALSLMYLYFYPNQYKTLFLLAFIPGLFAIVTTLLIKEKTITTNTTVNSPITLFSFLSYWKNSSPTYKKLVAGLIFFALFNSSDIFLLLQLKQNRLSDTEVIAVYIFYNFIYAILAYPLGILADKLGNKKILLLGIITFALVYVGFAFSSNLLIYVFLFALYGLYAAATEGVAKAWISNIAPKNETATAIGTFAGLQSIAALFASSFCGLLWYKFGATATFVVTAIAAFITFVFIFNFKEKN